MLGSGGGITAGFAGLAQGFVVVAFDFGFVGGFAGGGAAVCGWGDGVVGGDVGPGDARVGVGGGVQVGELGVDMGGAVSVEGAGEPGGVGFADGFAVPACAFGIEFVVDFLVGFGGPFEGGGEFGLFDFVVVVDKGGGVFLCISVV